MKQQSTKYNIEGINRHWLVWLKPNYDYSIIPSDQKSSIQKHINKDLPFVCARFTPNQTDHFNLGYCNVSNTKYKKSKRYSVQANVEAIDKYRPPLLMSEVIANIPSQYADKLNHLIKMFTEAELPEPRVFGSYLWQSITGESHIRPESDLDLIVHTDNLENMCVYTDIFKRWEHKFNIKIDCEFCLDNNIFFSSKELFTSAKQLLIKTKDSIELMHKKDLLNKLQSISYNQNLCPTLISNDYSPEQLAFIACRSLYSELAAYPKPGLVSFYDTGSHSDMDHTTFTKSIRTLYEYFANIADAVMHNCSFHDMVDIGIKAENRMSAATDGINTHKGAIFSLGLLVAATAKALKNNIPVTPESVQKILLDNWSHDIINHTVPNTTHGRKVVNDYNANGILKEAANGFPIVFNTALPCLRKALKKTKKWNDSLIETVFQILTMLDDTNILYRGGDKALEYVRDNANSFLTSGGVYSKNWCTNAEKIHQSFIEKQLSPGGCADMLACTVFIYYIVTES